jgi:hypothetical protein
LLPVTTLLHAKFVEPVKVPEPTKLSVTGNVLVLTAPALTPAARGHELIVAAIADATVEVVGKVLAGASSKVPGMGDEPEQALDPLLVLFPLPGVTDTILDKPVKLA